MMSLPGLVFLFVFLENVMFSLFIGFPSPTEYRTRHSRAGRLALVAAVSLIAGLLSSLLARAAAWAGAADALPPAILCVVASIFVLCEAGIRFFSTGKRALIKDFVREAEFSGIAFAVAIAVSGTPLGPAETCLAILSSICGYAFFKWAFIGIVQRLALATVPRSLRGVPVLLLSAALVSFAFMALDVGFIRVISN